jgi:hypothetical protein
MHEHEPWTHARRFLGARHDEHARRTRWVVALTFGRFQERELGRHRNRRPRRRFELEEAAARMARALGRTRKRLHAE